MYKGRRMLRKPIVYVGIAGVDVMNGGEGFGRRGGRRGCSLIYSTSYKLRYPTQHTIQINPYYTASKQLNPYHNSKTVSIIFIIFIQITPIVSRVISFDVNIA